MANKDLKSIEFPGLPDVYTIPEGGAETFDVVFTDVDGELTCDKTVDEIYEAYKASLQPGGKRLVAYTPYGVMDNVTLLEDYGVNLFWIQFLIPAARNDDFTNAASPYFYAVNVINQGDKPSFSLASASLQSAIMLESIGAIPKTKTAYGLSDEFEIATPNTDYMTPSMGASGAKVGQMLKVKTVDASGNPTAWETGDALPTIGDNGNWYLGETDTGKPSRGATGAAGHSPVVTASKSGKVTTIKVDGKAIATVNDGADGANGKDGTNGKDGAAGSPGANGITPEIGANGNWYLGETDTGKPSRGEKGETGAVDITALSQSEYAAASAAGTLDEGKWYGVYPDA